MKTEACITPLEVKPLPGEVAITSPDGVAIFLTRQAAIVSAKRILEAAGADEATEIYQKPLG